MQNFSNLRVSESAYLRQDYGTKVAAAYCDRFEFRREVTDEVVQSIIIQYVGAR